MSGEFTDEQISEYKEAFCLFDKNNDGKISAHEMGIAMRSLGLSPTEEEVQSIFDKVGKESIDAVDFREFLIILAEQFENNPLSDDELIESFRVFDREGDGTIATGELRHIMTNLGEKLSDGEIDEMIRCADPSGQGFILYENLVREMTSM